MCCCVGPIPFMMRQIILLRCFTSDSPDVLVVDTLAFWHGRLGSFPELIKFTQVAIDSPPM